MSVKTINPATEEILREFQFETDDQIEKRVEAAADSFSHWRLVKLETRLECVRVFSESLRGGRIAMAEMIQQEMGKSLTEALSEVDKSITSCEALLEQFPKWKSMLEYKLENGFSVSHEPLGPLLGIMPWNFPLWQVVRFAIPALLCGNSILLKHAPNTWGCAEFINDFFRQAFPFRLYQNLQVDVPVVSKLIADRRIRGVSLTGSRRAGQSVAELAGKHLKKCVLELGGSDAYVILDDADLSLAAKACAKGRLINAGQSCVAAKRFIVTKKNHDEFTEKLKHEMSAMGQIAPMARQDLREGLHSQVTQSLKQGAVRALGAELPSGKGFFYPASVLTQVRPGQPAFDDELFGPVAAVIEAPDEKHAFSLANRSIYGLGGAVFSRDVERAKFLARTEMEAGMVFVNDFVRSDVHVPFGGIKDSGLGRELGREGAFEFTNIKTVFA